MQRTCTQCSATFEITQDDRALLEKVSPEIGGTKYLLPPPTHCRLCRLQRRLAFYNCRSLYRRTCAFTKRPIIAIYSPDKDFTVYDKDVWWSDQWDPMAYGRDVDFSRPFFEQFAEFNRAIPQIALAQMGDNVNSDYTNDNYRTKNCYLVFDGEQAQDCYYGHSFIRIRNCVDFVFLANCELCYECVHCIDCYGLTYSRYCKNCFESWFLRDCIGCRHCFGCANLRQKEYCIWNAQKTKEEFEQFMGELGTTLQSSITRVRESTTDFFHSQPVRAVRGEQNIDCLGDNLDNSKNAYMCFDSLGLHDCRYCTDCMVGARDCMDIHIWGDNQDLCYESCLIGNQVRSIIGCYYVLIGADNVFYSLWCGRGSRDLFGCVGLRHKQYCVLNKQYTREQYGELVGKLIEHMRKTPLRSPSGNSAGQEWGEFFPVTCSSFGYNETMAQTFFPLTKEDALQDGFQWCDYESEVKADRSIRASDLPDDACKVPDDVLNWAICCEVTGKPFKVVKQELEFYRAQKLPFPHRHPDQRHCDRFALKNPYKLWTRTCAKCGKEIQTTYSPDRPEIVYCEQCYLKEVY